MRGLAIAIALTGCTFRAPEPAGGDVDAMSDGAGSATPDGANGGFDPSSCPSSYDVTLPSSPKSRYRVIVNDGAFAVHHAACNADLAGSTHLASPETATEIVELQTVLMGLTVQASSSDYYIGGVQTRDQALPTDGWRVFTGGAVPGGLWASGQPNDDVAGENNEENLVTLNKDDLLHDATGDFAYGAVCECDGKAIDSAVAAQIP